MQFLERISCIILTAFLIAGACSIEALSQQPQITTVRTEVSLVNVIFTVVDKYGRLVRGMKKEDFLIFEDKVPQKIEFFSEGGKSGDVPLTIALLIDTSESVKDKLDFEKSTAIEFFKEVLRPNKDLALIIQFDSDVNLVQDFTQNQKDLVKAINSLRAANNTALYDAIYLAAEEKLKLETGRKLMVVITDGEDNASKVRKESAIEAAQKDDVLIYGIGVNSEGYRTNFGVLKKFAEETGGAFFTPHTKFTEIQAAFRSIGEEIQGQYSLGYSSTNKSDTGGFRTIEMRSTVPGLRVRARKGYYASKQSASADNLHPRGLSALSRQ
jgi:VWFA-related protein